MTNWCQNRLTVQSHDGDAVLRFIEANAGGDSPDANKLSFNSAVPFPKEQHEDRSDYEGSLQWKGENWGPHWDACDVGQWQHGQDKLGNRYASVIFDTAWVPPIPWLQKVSELHQAVDLRLEFSEPGIGFQGISYAEAGFYDTMEMLCQRYEETDEGAS